jgi:hypothetical protein
LINSKPAGRQSGRRLSFPAGCNHAWPVRRADGVSVAVRATNYVPGPNALPPLSMAQVVTAAADPRWSWTMDGTFVAGAARLHLAGPAPGLRAGAASQPAMLAAQPDAQE